MITGKLIKKEKCTMKKMLVSLFTLAALIIGARVYADCCPCQANPCCTDSPCATPCPAPCNPCCDCCCEKWLNCRCLEDYFCRMCFNECQKAEALCAIERFKCCTKCLRLKNCKCESKRECRAYRKALRNLDCDMKKIITRCQKDDYKCVRREVKDQVKCCHSCLIWPFKLCKCNCDCGCACNNGCGCCGK